MRVDVALTPEGLDSEALPTSTVLVIDVLRASTTMIAALGNGCAGIVPVADAAEAFVRRGTLDATALIAGERKGQTIEGFDLGNSPLEVTRERVGGRLIVFTTSNGTRALLAARTAAAVGVAALVNVSAAVTWALGEGRDVTVICAGERGGVSLEDNVCAGLLVDGLLRHDPVAELTQRAEEAREVGRAYGKAVARLAHDSPWARHLALSGRGDDVAACLALDTTPLVPVLATAVVGGAGHVDNVIVASR